MHDVLVGRHLDLAERHRDAQGGAAVGEVHRLVVCSVQTVSPRDFASRIVWMVSSGVLVCTWCTSPRSVIPARSIATFTASATLVIIAVRPMSSGPGARSSRSRPSAGARRSAPASVVAKIVACGLITPSVPPDHDRDLPDGLGVGALLDQHLAERPVGDDPRVVVDAAVALGLCR